jgi:hypothetical protein
VIELVGLSNWLGDCLLVKIYQKWYVVHVIIKYRKLKIIYYIIYQYKIKVNNLQHFNNALTIQKSHRQSTMFVVKDVEN